MAEFASNAKGNLAVTLGSIGTGLGVLGGALGNTLGMGMGNGFRNGNCFGNGYGMYHDGYGMYRDGFGCGAPSRYGMRNFEDEFVTRYDADKDAKIARLEQEIALGKAEKSVDKKGIEIFEYIEAWRHQIEKDICEKYTQQAVYNTANTANINCLSGRVSDLEKMTKLYIPSENVSPTPMPLLNSWTAPTT